MEIMVFLVWAVAALGALSAVGMVVAMLVPSAGRVALGLSGLVLGFGLCSLMLGALGRFNVQAETAHLVAGANPDYRATVIAEGEHEAALPMRAGALGGVPLVLVAAGAMVLVSARARRVAEVTP